MNSARRLAQTFRDAACQAGANHEAELARNLSLLRSGFARDIPTFELLSQLNEAGRRVQAARRAAILANVFAEAVKVVDEYLSADQTPETDPFDRIYARLGESFIASAGASQGDVLARWRAARDVVGLIEQTIDI